MSDIAITLEQVALTLGAQDFIFDVEIKPKKITAIVGPSGSGKSTLLNLISGFERPDSGRVWFGAEDVTNLLPAERNMSLIFQDHNLFAHLDVFTNVALGISPSLRLSEGDKMQVMSALEKVGLGSFSKRLPGDMSGGERQRAAIARMLVRNKPITLLDEPFAALDPSLRRDMGQLLIDLQMEQPRSVLLVTHQRQEVERLADEVIFINRGKISFVGNKSDFLNMRSDQEILKFIGA